MSFYCRTPKAGAARDVGASDPSSATELTKERMNSKYFQEELKEKEKNDKIESSRTHAIPATFICG